MEVAFGLLALVAIVCACSALGQRINISVPLLLVLAGVVCSFLPFVPTIELNPEIVLVGLLPPLLYAAALQTSLFDFRSNRRSIGLLSVGYVIFGTVSIGLVVAWLFPEIPLAAAMALGAVVAPPDAVAATAIARKVGMPRRVVTILEGESLVNDATALVCLRAAIAAIAGAVSAAEIAGGFVLAAGGGVAVGVAAAFVLTALRKRIRNVAINTSTSLIAPLVAYLPAEAIHASGVLAVVVTGLIMGTKAPSMPNGAARLSQRSNWHTVQFLLENSVFLLIGLQVRTIIEGVRDDSLGPERIWFGCAAVLLAVLVLRPVWVFPATYLPRLIPALILAGMLQVLIPQETVSSYFGRDSGLSAILLASVAGILTPGGPMVSVPLLVVLANSGMALGPLVAYMTSWSLFGMQRIIAWEAPLMGWRFVAIRVLPSLAFPVIAGWLVKLYYHE